MGRAVDSLAALYDGGDLMAATDSAELLELAVAEIRTWRGADATAKCRWRVAIAAGGDVAIRTTGPIPVPEARKLVERILWACEIAGGENAKEEQ